jgi:hypothetical protein
MSFCQAKGAVTGADNPASRRKTDRAADGKVLEKYKIKNCLTPGGMHFWVPDCRNGCDEKEVLKVYKSQMSQLLFATCFGPIGLIYSSMPAALLLTVLTVIAALFFLSQIVYVVIASLILSVFIGDQLVCAYNRNRHTQLHNPGTYLGGVRCRVIGKGANAPHYAAALNKARWHRRAVAWCKYFVSPVVIFTCTWFAQPEPVQRAFVDSVQRMIMADDEPGIAAAHAALRDDVPDMVLSEDPGIWRANEDGNADVLAFVLKARNFVNSPNGWIRPELQLECRDNRTSVLLIAHEVLGTERARVQYRLDVGHPVSSHWALRSDYSSAIAANSIALARLLRRHKDLQVSYQPFHSDHRRTINFELQSASEVVDKVRRRCSW